MEIILQPWPWYVGGPLIGLILFLMFYFGQAFGVSSNLETFCTISGAGKFSDYFKTNWKSRTWSLLFVLGIILGGYISSHYLMNSQVIDLNPETIKDLANIGFANAGDSYLPPAIFSTANIFTLKGISILVGAGILIGFGSRYAGGCTSGHSITGISSLQLPSILATIGFFIGGIIMAWFIIPLLFENIVNY